MASPAYRIATIDVKNYEEYLEKYARFSKGRKEGLTNGGTLTLFPVFDSII